MVKVCSSASKLVTVPSDRDEGIGLHLKFTFERDELHEMD